MSDTLLSDSTDESTAYRCKHLYERLVILVKLGGVSGKRRSEPLTAFADRMDDHFDVRFVESRVSRAKTTRGARFFVRLPGNTRECLI